MAKKKILWATDFSTSAAHALPLIKDRIRIDAAEIHLLYVSEDLTEFESFWGSGPDKKHAEGLRQFAERQSKKRLQELCDCELEGCTSYAIHFAQGRAADEILAAATSLGVDEVVVARPPLEGATSFGAAVDWLIVNSDVPVTAIAAPSPSGPPSCADKN
jgi:nucleotide-binding universal stress UspA family protein